MNLQDVENALDNGHLWLLTRGGKYVKARRNGRTKLWKTRPREFRIPLKFGLYGYAEITHESEVGPGKLFSISEERP